MPRPTRFIGLDIHKRYLVAAGVDADKNPVFGPHKVTWEHFDAWRRRHLTRRDAVVIEMTTNTWEVYDMLEPHVHSVTVVHPPHVKLIAEARVMTDKIAALKLAKLLAGKDLPAVWVPPQEVRELRALTAQHRKMTVLATQAKNRLHATLHRHQISPPEGVPLFHPDLRPWWHLQKLPPAERSRLFNDLDTLEFANRQKATLEKCLAELAAGDERIPLLVQLPGVAVINAMTILAAIGDVRRFPEARRLVGYAGLGVQVKESGGQRWTGKITKSGRRDLRRAMVNVAHHAVQKHPFWKEEYERLSVRIGKPKAIVAIARKLLVAVWHILTQEVADRHADAKRVAASFFAHAYKVGVKNLPRGMSAKEYTRWQLDRLGIGREIEEVPWGSKRVRLPLSRLIG